MDSNVPPANIQLATVKAVLTSVFATVIITRAVVRLTRKIRNPEPVPMYHSQSSLRLGFEVFGTEDTAAIVDRISTM